MKSVIKKIQFLLFALCITNSVLAVQISPELFSLSVTSSDPYYASEEANSNFTSSTYTYDININYSYCAALTAPTVQALGDETQYTIDVQNPTPVNEKSTITVTMTDKITSAQSTYTVNCTYVKKNNCEPKLADISLSGSMSAKSHSLDIPFNKDVFDNSAIIRYNQCYPIEMLNVYYSDDINSNLDVQIINPDPNTVPYLPNSWITETEVQLKVTAPDNSTNTYKIACRFQEPPFFNELSLEVDNKPIDTLVVQSTNNDGMGDYSLLSADYYPNMNRGDITYYFDKGTKHKIKIFKSINCFGNIETYESDSIVVPGQYNCSFQVGANGTFDMTVFLEEMPSLSDIKLDGKSLSGFTSSNHNYNVTLPNNTSKYPTISVVENNTMINYEPFPGKATINISADNLLSLYPTDYLYGGNYYRNGLNFDYAQKLTTSHNKGEASYTIDFSLGTTTNNKEMEKQEIVYANNKLIYIKADAGSKFELYTITGELIHTGIVKSSKEILDLNLTNSFYILKINDTTHKIIVK